MCPRPHQFCRSRLILRGSGIGSAFFQIIFTWIRYRICLFLYCFYVFPVSDPPFSRFLREFGIWSAVSQIFLRESGIGSAFFQITVRTSCFLDPLHLSRIFSKGMVFPAAAFALVPAWGLSSLRQDLSQPSPGPQRGFVWSGFELGHSF